MRWIDKPRKKTRREIVLEYIKFMKIMGYYPKLIHYMYLIASFKDGYFSFYDKNGKICFIYGRDIVSHKQAMIGYFEYLLRRCGSHLNEHTIRELFIQYPLSMYDYNKSRDLTALLWSYFKEKHIDNCIIIGD